MKIDLDKIPSDFRGFYVIAKTDAYDIGYWREAGNVEEEKVLELRIFNESGEYKWFRGSIGEDFHYRYLGDGTEGYEEPIVEYQLLDVDLKKECGKVLPAIVKTSRGGSYYLPVDGELKKSGQVPCVRVKYYIPAYDSEDPSTVHAYVKDWRLAGFEFRKAEVGE